MISPKGTNAARSTSSVTLSSSPPSAREREGAVRARARAVRAQRRGARGVGLGVRREARTDVERPLVVHHPARPARARGAALGLLRASARVGASPRAHTSTWPGAPRRSEPAAESSARPARTVWTKGP